MTSEDRMAGDRLDLDAIEARLKAATPGPWHVSDSDDYFDSRAVVVREMYDFREPLPGASGRVVAVFTRLDQNDSQNAEFVAHAPEDIAALLAEVQALRARAVPDPREAAPEPSEAECEAGAHALVRFISGYHMDDSWRTMAAPQRRWYVEAVRAAFIAARAGDSGAPHSEPRRCSQCGEKFTAPACGPTHAAIYNAPKSRGTL